MSPHRPAQAAETVKTGNPAATGDQPPPRGRRILTSAWNAVVASFGAVMGLLPHVLHHVGLLGGAVFVTGASGMLAPARARLAAELAAEASAYVSPLPVSHPEELLLAIIALRREREATALRLEKARMLRLDSLLEGRPHAFPDRG